jgi:hypothetical protein
VKQDALLLTAACVWLLNGLHARPDDGSSARSLMRAVLPTTDASDPDIDTLLFRSRESSGSDFSDDDDDHNHMLPYSPFGAIFLRRVVLDVDVPRMRVLPEPIFLTDGAFQDIFNASQEIIRERYSPSGILPRGMPSQYRVTTSKKRQTIGRVRGESGEEELLFDLSSRGYCLPPPPVDDGSDVEIEETADENDGNIDKKMDEMWRQFLVDVAMKSPNPRSSGSASYLKLTEDERARVTSELYLNLQLSDMWRACSWKVGSLSDRMLAFSHLFPEQKHETSPTTQNYTQCRYYVTWKQICASTDSKTVDAMRRELQKKVLSLNWIPFACSDKMWSTQQKTKGYTRYPPNSDGPAPHILCKAQPSWADDSISLME